MSSIWRTLGIASTRDRAAIRRAYAARLKVVHPEDDPGGFQALRAAYEQALRMADMAARHPEVADSAWDDGDFDGDADGEALTAGPEWRAAPADLQVLGDLQPAGPAPGAPSGPPIDRVGREETQALQASLQALRQAVAAEDRDAARAGLQAVLGCSAMDSVSVRAQVEGEIGSIILQGGLGAAVLIDPASAAFGWTSDRLGAGADLAAAVQARRADLALLVSLRSPHHALHSAFRALTEKPVGRRLWRNRLWPGLPQAVRKLMDLIYGEHGGLARELDEDAVAWWSSFLNRPHLGPLSFWTLVFGPLVIASGMANDGASGPSAAAFGQAYAITLGGTLAAFAVWIIGIGRARVWWQETRGYTASAWERYGWAGLALGNLVAAAFLPSGALWAWAGAPPAFVAFAWAVVTADADDGPVEMMWSLPLGWLLPFLRFQAKTPQWVLLALGLIPLALVWTVTAVEDSSTGLPAMVAPLIGAGGAFVAGHHSLENVWRYRIAPMVRRLLLIPVGLVAAGMPMLLWMAAPGEAYVPLALAGLAALVFAERIVTLGWDARMLRDKLFHWGGLPAFIFAVAAEEEARQGNAVLLGGALWLMAGVAAGTMTAIRREREMARLAPA